MFIQCISDLIIGYNCNSVHNPSLNIFITIGNISNISVPFILSYLRLRNPLIKQRVIDLLVEWKIIKEENKLLPKNIEKRLFQTFKESNQQLDIKTDQRIIDQNTPQQNKLKDSPNDQLKDLHHKSPESEERLKLDKFSIELGKFSFLPALLKQKQKNESDWINQLASDLRVTEIYTMLVGIRVHNEQQQNQAEQEIYQESQNIRKEIIICEDMVKRMIEQSNKQQSKPQDQAMINQITVFKTKMTIYAPEIFQKLQSLDGNAIINFKQSLDFEENYSKIKEACGQADGGRSGEFFFFSNDNKLILKTMKEEELQVFLDKLYAYYQHFTVSSDEKEKDSLLVKIYGVYRFERVDGSGDGNEDENQIILVMRNLAGCPSKYIKQIYDLKGSTFQREVSEEQKQKNKKCVLKDKEFWQNEQRIWIRSEYAERCKNALLADSAFLAQCELIDYSLLIMKIDWEEYCKDFQCTISSIQNKIGKDIFMIQSTKEKNIFYHIGVIDYLQIWNLRKNLELKAKNMINLGDKDVSVQEPNYYSERFCQKVVNKIFNFIQIQEENSFDAEKHILSDDFNIHKMKEDVFQ